MEYNKESDTGGMDDREIRTTSGIYFDRAIMHEPDSTDTSRRTTFSVQTDKRVSVTVAEVDWVYLKKKDCKYRYSREDLMTLFAKVALIRHVAHTQTKDSIHLDWIASNHNVEHPHDSHQLEECQEHT